MATRPRLLPPRIRRAAARRGQSLIEFLMIFPLMMLLVVGMVQMYNYQETRQSSKMAMWTALRASTYDFMHNYSNKARPGSEAGDFGKDKSEVANLQADIDETFFQRKHEVEVKFGSEANFAQFLGVFSILNPIDISWVKSVEITVKVLNPFKDLRFPFAKSLWGIPVETSQGDLFIRDRGYLFASWTSMVNPPEPDPDKVKEIKGGKFEELARIEQLRSRVEQLDELAKNAKGDAQAAYSRGDKAAGDTLMAESTRYKSEADATRRDAEAKFAEWKQKYTAK